MMLAILKQDGTIHSRRLQLNKQVTAEQRNSAQSLSTQEDMPSGPQALLGNLRMHLNTCEYYTEGRFSKGTKKESLWTEKSDLVITGKICVKVIHRMFTDSRGMFRNISQITKSPPDLQFSFVFA